jgi:membrane-associated phospholipid phosphatase
MTDQLTRLNGPAATASTASTSPRQGIRGPGRVSPWEALVEFGAGFVLLGLATLAGLVFVRHPWPNRLDRFGYRLLPANPFSNLAHGLAGLGSTTALIVGVVAVFFIGVRRDWVRAVACAAAPVIAVLIVQEIAKPLVDRHIGGGLSYPSGTVAAAAAVATALTLVMPAKLRLPVGVLGLVAVLGAGAGVIVLRWHYPTDALGGIGVGVGSVLLIDSLSHAPWVLPGFLRSLRASPAPFNERPKVSTAGRRVG